MNKLKAIILACVAVGFESCLQSGCDDCTYRETKSPAYANESGIMVKLVTIQSQTFRYEKFIDYGYTLNSSYYLKEDPEEWYIPYTNSCGIVHGGCDDPIRMELHFLDSPEKCLVFDGPIEHNGIDMRSWESYKKGKELGYWGRANEVEYIYTITPELRATAKKEDCENL